LILVVVSLQESLKPAIRQRGEVKGVENVKKAVSQYMAQLHAVLQMKEDDIFAKIGMLEQNLSVSLTEVGETISNNMDEMDRLIEAAKYVMKPEPQKSVDLADVLDKVENLAKMPCFFVEETSENDASVE